MTFKSFLKYFFLFLLIAIIGTTAYFYESDKTVEELTEKWGYENSEFVEIQGINAHYRINGEGDPLVLIHGTGASLHTWEKWTTLLESDFQIISLDMPAFGMTGPSLDCEYSLENYAQFLDAFLEKIGIDSFHLAGNSLGGAIAWKYTSMFPEKVEKLVLIDASGYPFEKELPLAFQLAKSDFWGKLLLKITPKFLFWKSIRDVYVNDDLVTDELVDRYFDLYLREGNRQAFVDRVREIGYNDASPIKTIKNKTLIMWGVQDEWIPVSLVKNFERDLIDSETIIYEDLGHVPMEENPEKTAADAKTFLLKKEIVESSVLTENSEK